MSNNDTIGNMITSIKNANLAKLTKINIKSTKLVYRILNILSKEGFIEIEKSLYPGIISVRIKYEDLGQKPYITNIVRISKPGLRVFVNKNQIPRIWGGVGICLLSTSKGILTGQEAKKYKVGGEMILQIW
uniref:Small ribosomal subunit protein uS8c n=1 Tax=Trachelomonas grandis TaxID=215769 RepID=A0A385UK08_9EUGL|nr:ribosomal protein S8 [Trachelomonas grandis]